MQSKSRCLIAVALLAAFFLLLVPSVSAAGAQQPDVTEASAVYFYHLESKRVMCEKNAETVLPAGSTVKILAGLIACERLSLQLGEEITVTQEMLQGAKGYQYGNLLNRTYTVQDLLYLAICGSYNNAYVALAYLIGGGSVDAFVEQMNQKAKALGAQNTTVGEPCGVEDISYTTAKDLFCISLAATENPLYMQISSSAAYDLSSGARISNRNALISKSEGTKYYNALCKGLSAGESEKGQTSLATLAQNGNDRYLCIVLGAPKVEIDQTHAEVYSYIVANRLIQWGYDNYRYLEILTPETEICALPVTVSDLTETVSIVPDRAFSAYLPADAQVGREVTYSVRLMYEELEAPVRAGTHVGYVAIVYNGEILGTVGLYTAQDAERSPFVSRLLRIRSLTQNRAVVAGVIFFAVTVLAWIVTEVLVKRRRRHKWDKYFSEKIDLPETILRRKK